MGASEVSAQLYSLAALLVRAVYFDQGLLEPQDILDDLIVSRLSSHLKEATEDGTINSDKLLGAPSELGRSSSSSERVFCQEIRPWTA